MDATIKHVLFSLFAIVCSSSTYAFEIDSSFADQGQTPIIFHPQSTISRMYGLLPLANGQMYVHGDYMIPENQDRTFPNIKRLNADGSEDLSFALDHRIQQEKDVVADLKVTADGNLIIALTEVIIPDDDGPWKTKLALTRVFPNGELDTSFANNGFYRADYYINSLLLDAQGRIYLHGSTNFWEPTLTTRLLANGGIDASFGEGGVVDNGVHPFSNFALMDLEDRFFVFGPTKNYGVLNAKRYTRDGNLDLSWGGNGIASFRVPDQGQGYTLGAIFQNDGGLVLRGYKASVSNELVRFDANGILDPNFGKDGRITVKMITHAIYPGQRFWQVKDEHILLADPINDSSGMRLMVWDKNGQTATSFGNQGVVEVPGFNIHYAAPHGDNKLLVSTHNRGEKFPRLYRYNLGLE